MSEEITDVRPITEPNSIKFFSGTGTEPIIEFKSDGDILIHGKLAENDKAVVAAMRKFLQAAGHY